MEKNDNLPDISSDNKQCCHIDKKNPSESKKPTNPFDEIVAVQKAAKKTSIEYRIKIKNGVSDQEAVECFFFYCKFQEHDKTGRTRAKLLRQVDDVGLVSIFESNRQLPILLARLIESRLTPKNISSDNHSLHD
jgi:hypothetical protein